MHLFLTIHNFKTFTTKWQCKFNKKKQKLKKKIKYKLEFYLKIIALLVILMAAKKFQYCLPVRIMLKLVSAECLLFYIMLYGTDIYIKLYQDGIPSI